MYLVYQLHEIKTPRRKRSKSLDTPLVHIMDGDKCLCGIAPIETIERDPLNLTERIMPGVTLYKLTGGMAKARLASSVNSDNFNLQRCWSCFDSIKVMMKYRESLELPEVIKELVA
jgi:hypothetical protein